MILTNARLVTADDDFVGTLEIDNGLIRSLDRGETKSRLPRAQDLNGDLLLPGLIELHTDNLERHFQPRPGVRWPPLPAVLAHDSELIGAGITTVFDALAVGSLSQGSVRSELLDSMIDAVSSAQNAGLTRADHRLHLRCEVSVDGVLDLWQRHADHPLLGLVSLMDHTPGQRQFVNIDKYREYYQGKHGFNDAEMEHYIQTRMADGQRYSAANRQRLAADCQRRRLALASHDDATLEHVEEAAGFGTGLAEFPTTVAAAEASRRHGMAVLMGAPNLVRGESHSGNVSARELGGLGLIDILSSDYIPLSLLNGAMLLHQALDYPLARAVATVSRNPARAVGLADRGELAPGLRADLLRVTLAPLDGRQPLPVVRAVWRAGQPVF